jgi:hypothetical protein
VRTLLPVVDNDAGGRLQENISIPGILQYAYIIGLTEFVSGFIFASLTLCCLSTLILKLVREIGGSALFVYFDTHLNFLP